MYEVAATGLGVTLAIPAVCEKYLRDGRLRPCFDAHAQLGSDYRLVMASPAAARRTDVRIFSQWIVSEVDGTRREFASMVAEIGNSRNAHG